MSALRFSDTISAALADGILVITIDNAPVNTTPVIALSISA